MASRRQQKQTSDFVPQVSQHPNKGIKRPVKAEKPAAILVRQYQVVAGSSIGQITTTSSDSFSNQSLNVKRILTGSAGGFSPASNSSLSLSSHQLDDSQHLVGHSEAEEGDQKKKEEHEHEHEEVGEDSEEGDLGGFNYNLVLTKVLSEKKLVSRLV